MKIEMKGKIYRAQLDPDHPRAAQDRPVLLIDTEDAWIPCLSLKGVYWIDGTDNELSEFLKWKKELGNEL